MGMTPWPRPPDDLGHAWGLVGAAPQEIWERLSPAYEARLAILHDLLIRLGFAIRIGGAGGQDGEYLAANHADGRHIFHHLEDPHEVDHVAATITGLRAQDGGTSGRPHGAHKGGAPMGG